MFSWCFCCAASAVCKAWFCKAPSASARFTLTARSTTSAHRLLPNCFRQATQGSQTAEVGFRAFRKLVKVSKFSGSTLRVGFRDLAWKAEGLQGLCISQQCMELSTVHSQGLSSISDVRATSAHTSLITLLVERNLLQKPAGLKQTCRSEGLCYDV